MAATILQISEWIDSEAPYIEATKGHDDQMEDSILHPDGEDSTNLGDVPHAEEKGSIVQRGLFAPYLYGRYTY
jgi:Mg2+ and Co2+ transporter CorA